MLQPLQGEREMRSTFSGNQSMNFVENYEFYGAKRVPCVRRKQQIQRLGSRDEYVPRISCEARSLGLGSIARPNGNGGLMERNLELLRGLRDAHERSAQVSFDVDS